LNAEHQGEDEPLRMHESTFRVNWRAEFQDGGEDSRRELTRWALVCIMFGCLFMLTDILISSVEADIFTLPKMVYIVLVVVEQLCMGVLLLAAIASTNQTRRASTRFLMRLILAVLLVGYLFGVYVRIMGWPPFDSIPYS
jgi:hypothetical protein